MSGAYKRHTGSIILTLAVVLLLFVAGPANALNIRVISLVGAHVKGNDIDFKIDVKTNQGLPNGEFLIVNYADIVFTMPDSSKKTCKVYDDKTVEGCDFLTVEEIRITGNDNYKYDGGYAYDNEGNGYDLGYGYGYGDERRVTHIKYFFVIDTSDLKTGDYSAVAKVHAGTTSPHVFSSDATKFTIFSVPNGNAHRDDSHEDEPNDCEHHNHDNESNRNGNNNQGNQGNGPNNN